MSYLSVIVLGAAFQLAASAIRLDWPCSGPGDLNVDGAVDALDLGVFGECMAGPDVTSLPAACGDADMDGDSDIDLADYAQFARTLGTWFPYGPHRENLEAEMLAMDLAGQLRAPGTEYERILGDLQLIRATYAELTDVIDDPDYVPNELIVNLDDQLPDDGYQALNQYYLLVDEEIHSYYRLLTFCDNLNATVLADEYAALPEVEWAQPNYLIGIDDWITVSVIGSTYRYDVDDGFYDCFDGCDCHYHWVIDVDEFGSVTLVLYERWGMPWCPWPEL